LNDLHFVSVPLRTWIPTALVAVPLRTWIPTALVSVPLRTWIPTASYFDHLTANGTRTAKIALDHRLIRFQAGGKLRLMLSNIGLGFVHHYPWVNPVMSPFSIALVGSVAPSTQTDSDLRSIHILTAVLSRSALGSQPRHTPQVLGGPTTGSALQAALSLPISNQFAALPDADTSAWEKPYWQ
jgi:hypothetical protein